MQQVKRLPNNYDVSTKNEQAVLSIVDDGEFSSFVTGQSDKLSPTLRKKVKAAMKDAGVKLNIFYMALAQKSAHRLARIMGAMDNVDKELLQQWRIKTMNNDELMELFSELNIEKHRTTRDLLDMSHKFETRKMGTDLHMSQILDEDPDDVVRNLSRSSKKRVAKFFKQKVIKQSTK